VPPEQLLPPERGDLLAKFRKRIEHLHRVRGRFDSRCPAEDRHAAEIQNGPETCAIPGYELFEVLGRGGMGVVYRARDRRFERDVAVKLLADSGNAEEVARFVQEAKITGQLQHPGIPAAHELGKLANGQPFLAMKLVKGQTLQSLLDQRPNPQHDHGRYVAIFEQVCHAVGYAHAHRVIHRDLKPSNIMVGAHGEVQVMDWGLAKVLGTPGPESEREEADDPWATVEVKTAIDTPGGSSSETRTGSVLGTPAYMSPEQAGGEIRKLVPRSDVFGLGAILCQILSGRPPYEGKDAHEVRLLAVRGELADALARLDSCGAEPDRVVLCKRCLAFRQEDRPADAGEVARAVAALREAADERARRAELDRTRAEVHAAEQGKRKRAVQLAAAIVAAVLLAGILGTAIGLVRAENALEDKTNALASESKAREAEKAARKVAEANEKAAKESEAETQAVLDFLENNVIAAARPKDQDGGLGYDVPLVDALMAALPFVDKRLGQQPHIEARLRMTMGESFRYLGNPKLAAEQFEKARVVYSKYRGVDHAYTLRSSFNLANAYMGLGQFADAKRLYEETLARQEATLGTSHPDTLNTMMGLASSLTRFGRHSDALKLQEQALALQETTLGADHPVTLMSLSNVASSYANLKRHEEALKLREKVLAIRKLKLGANHPDTLRSMFTLAYSYSHLGREEEALQLRQETLALQKRNLGLDHTDTLSTMHMLASSFHALGRETDALRTFEETLRLRQVKLGPDHPDTLVSMWGVASALGHLGRGSEAVAILDECVLRATGKIVHPDLLPSVIGIRLEHFKKAKDHVGCGQTAEMWEKLNRTDAESLYRAACIRAITATVCAKNASPSTTQTIPLANEHAERAMKWLQKAVAAGYKDAERLKKNKDFDALREREDFKKLLTELDKATLAAPMK
jgi:tetratricopeptide (TPR) repeat protein